MKIIPLHSLVLLIGPFTKDKDKIAYQFDKSELIYSRSIKRDLVGHGFKPLLKSFVDKELISRVETKLQLGNRVVVNDLLLNKESRVALSSLARYYKLPVFYMYSGKNIHHVNDFDEIKKGDHIAESIDIDKNNINPIEKIDKNNMIDELKKRGFSGITVIPDVHGMSSSLNSAISWGLQQNHYLIFLGDLIDYGPNNFDCVTTVHKIISQGKGYFIPGNHEIKIIKWLQNTRMNSSFYMKVSAGNQVTIDEYERGNTREQDEFFVKLMSLFLNGSYFLKINKLVFSHAAINNEILNKNDDFPRGDSEKLLLYGQVDFLNKDAKGRPSKLYDWIEDIKDYTVFVGHDIRSSVVPYEQISSQGGKAVFLDTGCGKGGPLTTADFSLSPLTFKNFNRH